MFATYIIMGMHILKNLASFQTQDVQDLQISLLQPWVLYMFVKDWLLNDAFGWNKTYSICARSFAKTM